MNKISAEYVTIGHPDRMCDTLAAKLIDIIQKKDGINSHAAIEVFATKNTIIFGGEVKTTLNITKMLLNRIVRETFKELGYTLKKSWKFGFKNIPNYYFTKIENKISKQSPDIAKMTTDKVEDSGFNDQGIFYGAYDGMTPTGQGYAKWFAQSFGEYIMNYSVKQSETNSSDIKIKVDIEVDKDLYTPLSVKTITIAWAGIKEDLTKTLVNDLFKKWVKKNKIDIDINNIEFIINGNSSFRKHGFIADTSMTGRKIAVNNISAGPVYMQNQIGGGSYIKPWHASDFLLPMYCNYIAKAIVKCGYSKYVNVAMSCSIGQTKIDSISIYGDKDFEKNKKLKKVICKFFENNLNLSPYLICKNWNFFKYSFDEIQRNNFVTSTEKFPWEQTKSLEKDLKAYVKKG